MTDQSKFESYERQKKKILDYHNLSRSGPGLFSIDAKLPDEWQRSVTDQTAMANSVKNGEVGLPIAVDSRNIPVDWDYKTATAGPWGEPTASRAKGWLPTGELDFGPGVGGWWNRTLHNITEGREDEEDAPGARDIIQNLLDNIGQAHAQKDVVMAKGAEPGEERKANLGILGTAAAGTIGATLEIIKNSWHSIEGEEVTPLTALPRIIGETFRTAGDLLQIPAEWMEEEVVGPRILANIELAQKYKLVTQEEIEGWDNWIGQLGIFPVWGRVASAVMTGKISREEFYSMDNEYRNQTAAKIAYTAWKDSAVKGEFTRRVRAGEDPRLLALELEDPVDEMVLEFIFDPLNALDIFYGGAKIATASRRAYAAMLKVGLAPEIKKTLGLLQKAVDLGDEAEILRISSDLAPMLQKGRKSILSGETLVGTQRGILKNLQTFNQNNRGEDFVSHFLDILRACDQEPSRTLNVYLATIEALSDVPEEQISGLKKLTAYVQQSGGKLDLEHIFKDEGVRSAILFKDLVSDASGQINPNFMDDLIAEASRVMNKSGPLLDSKGVPVAAKGHKFLAGQTSYVEYETLTKLMAEKLESVLQRRFPVIQDAVVQNKKYVELVSEHGEESKQVVDYLRKHPTAATEPSPALQRLIPFHEKTQKYFYKPSANVQSKIFMGLNPAYMYRNRIGNAAALLVDKGPSAAFRAMAPRMLGGEKRAITSVKEWTKTPSLVPGLWRSQTGAQSAFELSEKAREWGPILRTAAQDERLARVHVAARTIPRVIKSVFNRKLALKGIDNVFESEEHVNLFIKIGKMNAKCDIDETYRVFNEVIKNPEIVRTLNGITPYDMHFLDALELDDGLFDILRSADTTQSDIIRHLEELKERIAEYGLLAAREPALMDMEPALGMKADEIMDIFISEFGEELGTLKGDEFMRRVNANFQWVESSEAEVIESVSKLRKQLDNDILRESAGTGVAQKARESAVAARGAVDQMEREVFKAAKEIQRQTRAAHHAFLDDVRKLSAEANDMTLDYLLDIWNGGGRRRLRFPLTPDSVIRLGPEVVATADGVGITPQSFKDALWETYRTVVEGAYTQSSKLQVETYRDTVKGLDVYHTGEIAEEMSGLAKETDELGAIAKMMQRAIVDPDTGEAAVHATKAELEMVLQRRYEDALAAGKITPDETAGNITQKLNDVKAKLAENPDLKIDDVIDKETKDALAKIAGPRWKQLASFMMDEGAEAAKGAIRTPEEWYQLQDVSAEKLVHKMQGLSEADVTALGTGAANEIKTRGFHAMDAGDIWRELAKNLDQPDYIVREARGGYIREKINRTRKMLDDYPEDLRRVVEAPSHEVSDELLDFWKGLEGQMPSEAMESARRLTVAVLEGDEPAIRRHLDEIESIVDNPELLKAVEAAEGAAGKEVTVGLETLKVRRDKLQNILDNSEGLVGEISEIGILDSAAKESALDIMKRFEGSMDKEKRATLAAEKARLGDVGLDIPPTGLVDNRLIMEVLDWSEELDLDPFDFVRLIEEKFPDQAAQLFDEFAELEDLRPLAREVQRLDNEIRGIETARAAEGAVDAEKAGDVAEATYSIPIVAGADGGTPSPNRFFHNVSPAADEVLNRVIDVVRDNFHGGIESKAVDAATHARFEEWAPEARKMIERARVQASRQAVREGDFAMHNYGERMGMDLLLGYIFPYQFWYSRSYMKWMQRAVRHPGLTAAYFRYKDTLAKEHAGLPDWWKYQLNTNELLGLDSEHPIWFNLEALANPIHGLTGIDFTDPKRRIDGWGAWMEDLNKFGPTVWAPFQLATILKYSLQGEEEAASRWAGRILPFSKPIRDLTALADPKGLGIDLDPYVYLFGGGIEGGFGAGVEAYERGRVGRQLGLMMNESEFDKADIIDATYNQEGEIWDIARARTIQERSPNALFALAPFFFGAGAKPRNIKDQQIDHMYGQMDGLIKQRDNMSSDQYRSEWQKLRQQYPFMDAILMSKKAGLERDEALAWNVLSRIPPGLTSVIAKQAGVDRKVLDAFYENKGDMNLMNEADRLRFMGSVLEIGGLLDVPEAATQAEWQVSRNLYKELVKAGKIQFGDDIWDMVDLYYATQAGDDLEASREFLRVNPIVSDAMDWKQVMVQNTPLLAAYYTSDERIRQFYKTQMYQVAEELFGEELWDQFEIYSRLKDLGEDKAAREFWKDNPGLKGYMELKEETLPTIEEKVDHFGTIIPEAKPPKYRHEDYDLTPQAPVSDTREAAITAQVLAYSEAYTDYSGQRTDIRGILRQQADEIWPNTRSQADTYYQMLSGGDASGASEYLSSKGELQARVMWEFDKIQRLDLTTLGQLFQAAGAAPGMEQPMEAPPGIDPNSPLGRLFNDPQGIPEHIWRAYLQYGQ